MCVHRKLEDRVVLLHFIVYILCICCVYTVWSRATVATFTVGIRMAARFRKVRLRVFRELKVEGFVDVGLCL